MTGTTLEPLSVIAMLVATAELLRSSAPSAENVLARDMAAATVLAMDEAFVDPSNAGTPAAKPAAITNGASAYTIHSSGASLSQIDGDLALMIEALSDYGSDMTLTAFVLRPRTALFLSLLRGSGGALAFPQLSVKGGTLAGLPAIVSAASPSSVGSPAEGGSIALVDAGQVLVADDGGGAFDVSRNATIAMEDAPGSPSVMVSMFQTDSIAIRTRRYVNWQACRPSVTTVLDQVAY